VTTPSSGQVGSAPPELAVQVRRLEAVLRHCSDAVVLLDAEARVTEWNRAAAVALGVDDPAGQRLADLLPDDVRTDVDAAWRRLQAGEQLASVAGSALRLQLGAVVHQGRLEGAAALWRAAPPRAPAGGLALTEDLRRGIAEGELRLHYQPIVELTSARPVATEALVRWQHPLRGLVGPQHFIEFAERTGQVVPLGDWVLGEACRTAAGWVDSPLGPDRPLRVSVNLSGRQLQGDHLVTVLTEALDATGCPPGQLVLEVTETAVMADLSAAVRTLTALKDLGVGLAIDDFGTGYSSLLYLKHFPVDTIKIDRSFVAGLGRDADDTAIVAATVSLAHSVDVSCVAEGVETVEHLDLLRGMGCDFAQGFLFSRPLELAALDEWCAAHRRDAAEGPRRVVDALPPAVTELLGQGASLHTIAAALNALGSRTERGTRWGARSVAHLIAGDGTDRGLPEG
jgi:EAL domain-containing protein (putative c-di-GMP-specific phosphodiesterase class I)